MTLAIGWPHDGGETVGTWPHEAGDWQAYSAGAATTWSGPVPADQRGVCLGRLRAALTYVRVARARGSLDGRSG